LRNVGRTAAKIVVDQERRQYGAAIARTSRRPDCQILADPYRSDEKEIRHMRIAQVAPLTEAVPPTLYGGTERVISWLTEELVGLGHDVTLFASGDSVTAAKLQPVWPRALRLDGTVRDANALHMAMIEQIYRRSSEFDAIHFHLDYYPFSLMSRQPTPFMTTLHGRLDLPEHHPTFTIFSSIPVVSISNAQRRPIPAANWIATVPHGLPVDALQPQPVQPHYLAFLGRISPEKRVDRAIRIAQRCGLPLKIAAKVDKVDEDYFNDTIGPLLSAPGVEFIGEIGDEQKSDFLSAAIALLVPIDWPEPFGLVMIEAMACGAPVIAFNRGSVAEIVEDGVTGFIVEDETSAAGAVRDVASLSRRTIRRKFEERFTARRMADDYLRLYRKLIDDRQPQPRAAAD
jgi:glycosyltransferase involved in cell wall biosynthesis